MTKVIEYQSWVSRQLVMAKEWIPTLQILVIECGNSTAHDRKIFPLQTMSGYRKWLFLPASRKGEDTCGSVTAVESRVLRRESVQGTSHVKLLNLEKSRLSFLILIYATSFRHKQLSLQEFVTRLQMTVHL